MLENIAQFFAHFGGVMVMAAVLCIARPPDREQQLEAEDTE